MDYNLNHLIRTVHILSEPYRRNFLPDDFDDFKQIIINKISGYCPKTFDSEFHFANWVNLFVPRYIINEYRNQTVRKNRRRDRLALVNIEDFKNIESKTTKSNDLYFEILNIAKNEYKTLYPKTVERDFSLISDYASACDDQRDIKNISEKYKMTRRNVYQIIKKFRNIAKNVELPK